MSRVSIDVTPQEHQRLKAMAALQGKTIKEFVLLSTIGAPNAEAALTELEALLDQRAQEAAAKGSAKDSVGSVFRRARRAAGRSSDA
ncbi:MAG: antitoxin [Planctomycetes bacterium]|nr:antitoxin [Planctomycetota bacterium]